MSTDTQAVEAEFAIMSIPLVEGMEKDRASLLPRCTLEAFMGSA